MDNINFQLTAFGLLHYDKEQSFSGMYLMLCQMLHLFFINFI